LFFRAKLDLRCNGITDAGAAALAASLAQEEACGLQVR
jgi:hypothetical protein